MRFLNLKKASDYEVEKWLLNSIKELTAYQKERIRNDEIIRFSGFEFYRKDKPIGNLFNRISIIFLLPILLIIYVFLPINFIIMGVWGYDDKNKFIGLIIKWAKYCNLNI